MIDIAIVGGGLAGLINSILLTRQGFAVVLFEKKKYPFHRVCGEYISNEVVPFLKQQQLYPAHIDLARIDKFMLSAANGRQATAALELGGFGISRYTLDHFLYRQAMAAGVDCRLSTTVHGLGYENDCFSIQTGSSSTQARLVIGAFGKRSTLDKQLNRKFISARSPYLAVKYHIRTDFPPDLVALHNFKDGYCGISKVEGETYNLCYLSHRNNLKQSGSVDKMERDILCKNPFLKSIFSQSDFLFDKPLVINEISFASKRAVERHILMTGDTAGMITPLCGNGMAMATHSAKLLTQCITNHWKNGKIKREALEQDYTRQWSRTFRFRLAAGRTIQRLFGKEAASNAVVRLMRIKPLARAVVRLTHGREF